MWVVYVTNPHDVFLTTHKPALEGWDLTECYWLIPNSLDPNFWD